MRIILLTRPSDALGGDAYAARNFANGLNECGALAEIRPANQPGDLSGWDAVILWAACSPDWGLPAALEVKRQGRRLYTFPFWWGRDERQAFYSKAGQDIAPGYLQGVAQTLQLSDALMVVAMSEARECWKLAPRKPVYVAGMGSETLEAKPRKPQDYVICLARVEKHKNQASLALACREIGAPLVLVGPVADAAYAAKCEALGAAVMGSLPRRDALELLAGARVHALVSFFENPGLASMEALQLGVPAVMGLSGAQVEYFGARGIYCDATNWRDIAGAVAQAWHAPRRAYSFMTWFQVAASALEWMEGQDA